MFVTLEYERYPRPLRLHFPFCDFWNTVEQKEGVQCPPREGEVEMMVIAEAPMILLPTDKNITARVEGLTADERLITCLNSTLEIHGPYG